MTYKKILAAVELPAQDKRPLAAARGIANLHRAELTALSILEPVSQLISGGDTLREKDFEAEMLRSAKLELTTLCREQQLSAFTAKVLFGSTAPAIADFAKRQGIDLITVGAHGFSGFEYFLGTTATGILHTAPCDVLGVRSDRGGRYQKLVVAIDGRSEDSIGILKKARSMAPDAPIEVVHVIKPAFSGYRAYIEDLEQEFSVEEVESRMHQSARRHLSEVIDQSGIDIVALHLLEGTPSTEIKHLLERSSAELAVMGSGKPVGAGWLIGSTTQNILHGSSCDVLVTRLR